MLGLFFLCTLFLRFVAQTLALDPPILGYEVVDLTWDLQIHLDGDARMIVNGTIEEAIAQLQQVNPNWSRDFGITSHMADESDLDKPENDQDTTKHKLAKRGRQAGLRYTNFHRPADCNPKNRYQWGLTRSYDLRFQQSRLWGMKPEVQKPKLGPGPSKCSRVSCAYRCAIWWCNDNTETITLGSFGDIADGADAIDGDCSKERKVMGQAFSNEGWNVVVRGDYDNC